MIVNTNRACSRCSLPLEPAQTTTIALNVETEQGLRWRALRLCQLCSNEWDSMKKQATESALTSFLETQSPQRFHD